MHFSGSKQNLEKNNECSSRRCHVMNEPAKLL